jgi:hypothetical protein
MQQLSLDRFPYRNFLWEFPPLTLVVVVPARWLSESAFTAVFAAEMVACEYATIALLRRRFATASDRSDRIDRIDRYWYAVALPLAAQAWFRLDFLSVVLAAWALVAILDHRSPVPPIVLGFLAKLWPVVLVAGLVCERRVRRSMAAVAGVSLYLVAWIGFSPRGFEQFLRYRHGSGFEIESIPGTIGVAAGARISTVSGSLVVGAGRFGWADTALLVIWAGLAVVCVAVGYLRPVRLVPLVGGLVVWLMLLSRILSPQYLVWALPFVAVCWAEGDRLPTGLFAVAAWCTTILDLDFIGYAQGRPTLVVLVMLRNALLVATGASLLWTGLRSPKAMTPSTTVPSAPQRPLDTVVHTA